MPKVLPKWSSESVNELKVFSEVRLIVADLDGTLVDSKTLEIYNNINQLLRTLKHPYKVDLVIATGRTLQGIKEIIGKLYLIKGMPLILYNGGLIISNDQLNIIYKKKISKESLEKIVNLKDIFNIKVLAYSYGESDWFNKIDGYEKVYGWSNKNMDFIEFNKMPIEWHENMDAIEKIDPVAILIEISEVGNELQKLFSELDKIVDITYTSSGFAYIEIRPIESNKANAIEYLAKELNYRKNEILTIGDNDNDTEMLAWAGIGVAVANASPNAYKNSNYVCTHSISEGVVEILRLVKNSIRYFK
jgi:5-amino-6-(5-phospho-D-ribitylamino)uracil phosphatase